MDPHKIGLVLGAFFAVSLCLMMIGDVARIKFWQKWPIVYSSVCRDSDYRPWVKLQFKHGEVHSYVFTDSDWFLETTGKSTSFKPVNIGLALRLFAVLKAAEEKPPAPLVNPFHLEN